MLLVNKFRAQISMNSKWNIDTRRKKKLNHPKIKRDVMEKKSEETKKNPSL